VAQRIGRVRFADQAWLDNEDSDSVRALDVGDFAEQLGGVFIYPKRTTRIPNSRKGTWFSLLGPPPDGNRLC
jgi:hypothetical protein